MNLGIKMKKNILNLYGDRRDFVKDTYGCDISSQRLDELDQLTLSYLIEKPYSFNFIDIGCGEGRVGLIASLLTKKSFLLDTIDITEKIKLFRDITASNVEFLNMDAKLLGNFNFEEKLDVIYSQRFIHYLTYKESKGLLDSIFNKANYGAKLFLSASGLYSELGQKYQDFDKPIESRFSFLSPDIAKKHNILEKVCLYSKEDLEKLVTDCGFIPEKIYYSSFGNIKGVFKK